MDKQKDFEKGWEEYKAKHKEEVEELSDLLYGLSLETLQDSRRVANLILKHYQPKLPENAVVVLTREEFSEKIENTWLNCQEFTRKETAEKIGDKAHKLFERDIKDSVVYTKEEKALIQELISVFDEICKEFTEGGGQ